MQPEVGCRWGAKGPERGKKSLFFQASPRLRLAQTEIVRHSGQFQAPILHSSSEQDGQPLVPGGSLVCSAYD